MNRSSSVSLVVFRPNIYISQSFDQADSISERLEREHQEFTRVKFIDQIRFGKYEIGTWYFSPYPDEYRRLKCLWICEFCLKYMKFANTWVRHVLRECRQWQPPGLEIYHKGAIRVFEVDGSSQKVWLLVLSIAHGPFGQYFP